MTPIEVLKDGKRIKTVAIGESAIDSLPDGTTVHLFGEKEGGLHTTDFFAVGKPLKPGETLELADGRVAKGV